MKRERFEPPEPDDPLCCCGDIDQQREYCCCDCEELDDACERLVRGEPDKPDIFSRFISCMADRLGLPCCAIGPLRLEISVLPPMVLIPGLLRVAAINCMLGVVVLTVLPGLVLWYYYVTHRRKRRTLFFLSLALFSLAYMYYLFLTEIVPRGDISNLQLVTVTTGMMLTLISLVRTKQGPGFVKSQSLAQGINSICTTNQSTNIPGDSAPCKGISQSNGEKEGKKKLCPVCLQVRPPRAGHCRICGACVLRMDHHCVCFVKSQSLAQGINSICTTNQSTNIPGDSAPCKGISQSNGEKEGKKKLCPVCLQVRPPRAGHCRICGACVLRMDHHCVWMNSCVGQANHRQFILTLLLFLVTSFYGISLVLRSVCPRQSLVTAMLYCPGVYNQYSTALCFTCVWYSVLITGGLLHLFILQIINVSYNVTEREAQITLRNKTGRRRFCGLVVETGMYSRGFLQNWIQFLTMNTDENGSPFTFTVMV
ncbi:palmitoyltransferase ZDHHC23-like [Sinocyclocheilus rhinocerous]|uniref:palmitoyltransferase ZDHHC23-like n=1 Tax=Sinocyclocheilus rhinocerous TaxID=307959 RepID=UPI0007B85B3A|nr:PREDICTED: palmitoyltransferase ZDHHC23-like [Sinocyclocheilus rhinocerous]